MSDDELAPVLAGSDVRINEATDLQQITADAKNLIRWCLQGVPADRPTVAEIVSHRFFDAASTAPDNQPMRYHGFMR